MRLSEACRRVVPFRARGVVNPLIDLIFVIGLVGACSTGIGLAVPLIGTLSSDLLGLDSRGLGFQLDLMVIAIVTFLFAGSAWLGLENGIRWLSNVNIGLAFWCYLVCLPCRSDVIYNGARC